jgi:hypothetical protein
MSGSHQVRVISNQYGRHLEPVEDVRSVPQLGGISLAHATRDMEAREAREKLARGPGVSSQTALAAKELLRNLNQAQAIEMLLARVIELESRS